MTELTSDTASAEVTLLVLGADAPAGALRLVRAPRVIASADRQSVADLARGPAFPGLGHNEPTLPAGRTA
jgi:hypothetical protein